MDDAWDISRKVEENVYFNFGSPVIENRKSKNNPFVHIDLFSGCGGFSCGFEQSGFVTELAIDIHKPSIKFAKKEFNVKNVSFSSSINDRKFDIIIISEVLEHLSDPTIILLDFEAFAICSAHFSTNCKSAA